MSPTSVGEEEIVGEVAAGIDLDLAALLNSMAVGVWVFDAKGEVVATNTVGLRMAGARNLAEVRAKSHSLEHPRFYLEDGSPIPPECMPVKRALAGELAEEMEFYDDSGGRRTVHRVRATPIRSPAGAIVGAVKVAVDVTKEHALARAKDDFIRTAAHELKTPLAVIKANAEAALHALQHDAAPAIRSLEGLSRGIERVDRLINSLLDLLDVQGGLFSVSRLPVHLDELIGHVISKLPQNVAARVRVTDVSPIRAQGDEPRLRRAVYSVLDNAFKYSPRNAPVEISLQQDREWAVISIRDHGIGIPFEKQSRIFEKYFRAHVGTPHDAGGIGVGLFVAREIVAQHGGRIWFESAENQGTTFFIELPIDRTKQP